MMKKAKIQIGIRDQELGTRIEERMEYVHGNYSDIKNVL